MTVLLLVLLGTCSCGFCYWGSTASPVLLKLRLCAWLRIKAFLGSLIQCSTACSP